MIRMATPEDLGQLRELWLEGENIFKTAPSMFRGGTFEDIENVVHAGRVLVYQSDEDVVGMVCVGTMDNVGLLGNLIVSSAWQGTGIGARLVGRAHEMARNQGATVARLIVWSDRKIGGFYQSAGYELIGQVFEARL